MIRALTLSVLFLVAACGFEPMHGQSYQSRVLTGELAAIEVRTPNTILGELLRAEIEDAVNPDYRNMTPRYRLDVTLDEQDIPLFMSIDGTSNRGDMRYISRYTLVRLADNAVMNQGILKRISSYNNSQTADYAAFVSREDAKRRAVLELAQDYKLRLFNVSSNLGAGSL